MSDSEQTDRPVESEAVEAAQQMNDPDGPQPGVVDIEPESKGSDPIPEIPQ